LKRYTDYDSFAWLYHEQWGQEFHEQARAVLDRLLLHRLKPRASILDLCCGDGRLTAELAESGFRMSGLDGSTRMLRFARRHAPRIEFVAGDARAFSFSRRFDAIISTFDALNHIMSADELRSVCECAYRALKPDGYFAFDLNREDAYTELWSTISSNVEHDNASIARGSYDPESRIAICDVTLFRLRAGEWKRSDFRLSQRCHSDAETLGALSEAGFRRMEAKDARQDLGMWGNIGRGRTFYLAQRDAR
jgi:SAM-dependent methyltransferase